MAIAYNSSVSGGNNGSTTNNLTFSFTNTAGNIVFVGFLGTDAAGADDITSVTYNSVSMTLVEKIEANYWTYLYMLENAPAGTYDVEIDCSSNHRLSAGAVSYSGAKTTDQPDASITEAEFAEPFDTALTSIADNCWHMLILGTWEATGVPTAGTATTRRVYDVANGHWGLFDSNSAKTPAGSVTLSTEYGHGLDVTPCHVMASFAPAIAAVLEQTHYRWRNDDGLLSA